MLNNVFIKRISSKLLVTKEDDAILRRSMNHAKGVGEGSDLRRKVFQDDKQKKRGGGPHLVFKK